MLLRKKYQTLNRVRVFEEALLHNFNVYKKLFPDKAICPVLKSNAYGHGLTLVAKVLEKVKPAFLIVDSLYEAYKLKKAGIKSEILILGYTYPNNLIKKAKRFHFTVANTEELETFIKNKCKVHLEIDTGFNRRGFSIEELKKNLSKIKKLNLEGLFTHLADAEKPNEQIKKFKIALGILKKAGLTPKFVHAANSTGALTANLPEFNMVRLGLSLYGINAHLKNLKPVMEVESTIIQIRDLSKGEKVSYSGTFTARKKMRIAVLPFGYYEGLPRSLSNKWKICGRVCMNHVMIDIENKNYKVGDKFIIYSKNQKDKNSLTNLAKLSKTIPYELFVGISESVRRELVPQTR